jgi:multisubunit Na+/H+ antiporter MnhF subunit
MRWGWLDERVCFLALLLVLGAAFWIAVVPLVTLPRAPDTFLGLAQLAWWVLCVLVALTLGSLLLRPPRD